MSPSPAPQPQASPPRSPIGVGGPAAISPQELQAWMARRRRSRDRMMTALAVVGVIVVTSLATVWTVFHRHLIASGSLQALGFVVDWDLNAENFMKGGVTGVGYRERWVSSYAKITRAELDSLRSLRHVESLDLSLLLALGDDDLAVVGQLPELTSLYLDRMPGRFPRQEITPLTDKILDHVAGLTRLRSLGLADNRITDAGLAKLANLQELETIDLEGTLVTDAGLMSLAGLKRLKVVTIERTAVTRKGTAEFQKVRPDVEVTLEQLPPDGSLR